MSRRVPLPPGCGGFTTARGERLNAKPGTSITLDDRDAASLAKSQHVTVGLLSATEAHAIGTKKGRWCRACRRIWQAWSTTCPRCSAATVPETDMGPQPASGPYLIPAPF